MNEAHLLRRLGRTLGSASYASLAVLCAVVITVGAVFYLWQRYQYVALGYEVSALRREKARLEEALEPLEVEAAYLSRLERIERVARSELGMRPPRADQVIVVEHDESIRLEP